MLRVFAYEYTCAHAGPAVAVPTSLQVEGWAMLSAILEDFCQLPDVEVITLLHSNYRQRAVNCRYAAVSADDEERAFRDLARGADFSLLIAPESDESLLTRCRWVEDEGCRLLGPSPAAVQLAGDKCACAEHLRNHGVRTPECYLLTNGQSHRELKVPAVLKPRHGAGSHETFVISCQEDFENAVGGDNAAAETQDRILQPYVRGQAASVAFILGRNQRISLLAGAQILSSCGRLRYLGGAIPLPQPLADRAVRLAERALTSMPGLLGYVGVDLVLGDAADGSEDWVIEINPRLTTSYIGLRALAQTNLAGIMLKAATGAEIAPPEWRPGSVRFFADGRVEPAAGS
jgi:predicted ATP-grasp superfamily ATP-dependent carboligase